MFEFTLLECIAVLFCSMGVGGIVMLLVYKRKLDLSFDIINDIKDDMFDKKAENKKLKQENENLKQIIENLDEENKTKEKIIKANFIKERPEWTASEYNKLKFYECISGDALYCKKGDKVLGIKTKGYFRFLQRGKNTFFISQDAKRFKLVK